MNPFKAIYRFSGINTRLYKLAWGRGYVGRKTHCVPSALEAVLVSMTHMEMTLVHACTWRCTADWTVVRMTLHVGVLIRRHIIHSFVVHTTNLDTKQMTMDCTDTRIISPSAQMHNLLWIIVIIIEYTKIDSQVSVKNILVRSRLEILSIIMFCVHLVKTVSFGQTKVSTK